MERLKIGSQKMNSIISALKIFFIDQEQLNNNKYFSII